MFLDEKKLGPRPEPWPARPQRRLSPRAEKAVMAIIFFNLLMMLVAPLGGATIVQGFLALFSGF
ncbi:MAG: hypothetical protein B7X99_17795 [Rhizobiales bacterium 17-65-6]|nr:MAG: hypothetical protein B7Z30_03580 [Rhizobiales bacterium 12-68-15]OYX89261.1 MAG: hypothetical protein B7Y84_05875 [Azorhizobium sp. 32-67-21]OYY08181.1 MAG: hypothetical protein B7Y70_12850 [Rhizobiales bacterium 35-68-8]OYZ90201.1 MAG: hypothetical protein B7X99_17795 [Rhizobiales bacterium 17-65-6]